MFYISSYICVVTRPQCSGSGGNGQDHISLGRGFASNPCPGCLSSLIMSQWIAQFSLANVHKGDLRHHHFHLLLTCLLLITGVILYKEFVGLGPLKISMFVFG